MAFRRNLRLLAPVASLAAVTLIGSGLATAPADARPLEPGASHSAATVTPRAGLTCWAQVVAVTGDSRLVLRTIKNDRVTDNKRSAPMAVDPTALGYFTNKKLADGSWLDRFSEVTSDGVPRVLNAHHNNGPDITTSSVKMAQTGFRPRLFADSWGYHVFTVDGSGALYRWNFSKLSDGRFRFDHKVKLGGGFGGLRTLQFGTMVKVDGRWMEYLYGTTFAGALKLIAVPLDRARIKRVVTLRQTGYQGVTELSTSYCNSNQAFSYIIAINSNAGTATWTTVRGVPNASPSSTVKHGAVAPAADWHLHAAM